MAMTKCRECGGDVSSEAKVCPHCGIETPEAKQLLRHAEPKTPLITRVGLFIILSAAFLFIVSTGGKRSSGVEPCASDWEKCTDNEQLVNNWRSYSFVQSACTEAATKGAKYGEPKFPWSPFQTFRTGNSAKEKGTILAIEKDARYSNMFGVMVHSQVSCTYDLKERKVVDLSVEEK